MTDHTGTLLDQHLLALWSDEDQLAKRQYEAFRLDRQWRDDYKDYDHITRVYERTKQGAIPEDDGMPHFNLMRQLIADLLGVLLPNIPDITLINAEDVDPRLPEFERDIRTQLLLENVETNNALVDKVLLESRYKRLRNKALRQAAVYGVGVISNFVTYASDPRDNFEVRKLVRLHKQGRLKNKEREALLNRSKRVKLKWLDTRECFWEAGRRSVSSEVVKRCSHIEWVDMQSLLYRNKDKREKILHGGLILPKEIRDYESSEARYSTDEQFEPSIVGVLTTYELVPINYKIAEGIVIEDYVLTCTKSVGSAIIEKKLITREGGEFSYDGGKGSKKFDSVAGAVRLPHEPIYIAESDEHPYGFSVVEQEELPEDAFNRIVAILMRYSDKSMMNAKNVILQSQLGAGDQARLDAGMRDDDQVFILIQGNAQDGEKPDIRSIMQPVHNTVPAPPPMLMNFGNYLLQQFQRTSSTLDDVAISRARSAAGKRAQIAAGDRPLLMPIESVIDGESNIREAVYDQVQALYQGKEEAANIPQQGKSRQVLLNQQVTELVPDMAPTGLPIQDEMFETDENPLGIKYYPAIFTVNSTEIPMRAVPEGYAGLPNDPEMRSRLLGMYQQLQWINPLTARRLGLNKIIRDIDDMNDRQMQSMAQQQDALQTLLGGGPEEELQGGVEPDQRGIAKLLNDSGNLEAERAVAQAASGDNARRHVAV